VNQLSTFTEPGHGALASGPTSVSSIIEDLEEILATCATPWQQPAVILDGLQETYQALAFLDFARIEIGEVNANGHDLCRKLFACQLTLRKHFAAWHEQGIVTPAIDKATRDVFRLIRFAIELIGEIVHDHPRLGSHQSPMRAFGSGEPRLLVNPVFAGDELRFQDGDVIVQRGRRHNSAAIARIGDFDSQFSHVGIVARSSDGEQVLVESLIEEGAVTTPIERALSHNIGRAALFRHREPALAARAARDVYDVVTTAQAVTGQPILYDFSMQLAGYDRLYCAKLVRLAFDRASDGLLILPRYPTALDMRNRDFLSRIGVTARRTFAPGDFDVETDFDLVAEWRDFRVTSELRLKGLLMLKLFEWMDRFGYRFRPDLLMTTVALLGRFSSHLPESLRDTIAAYAPKVPVNMTSSAIAAVAMLHETAEPIYEELQALEDETVRATGLQLQPRAAFWPSGSTRRALRFSPSQHSPCSLPSRFWCPMPPATPCRLRSNGSWPAAIHSAVSTFPSCWAPAPLP